MRGEKLILRYRVQCGFCHRLCEAIERQRADDTTYTLVEGTRAFFVACYATDFKLWFVCEDCKGAFMPFSETKEKFMRDMEGFQKLPAKERDAVKDAWNLRLMFEIYGELSSLAVSYKKMVNIHEARAGAGVPSKQKVSE